MTTQVTIYHNPRCSKSRQTLALIEEKGIKPEIVLYLETPPSKEKIGEILGKLSIQPRQLMRVKEDLYKENQLADKNLSNEQLIAAMVKFPKLIERPIVLANDKAILGRPPENVLEIL